MRFWMRWTCLCVEILALCAFIFSAIMAERQLPEAEGIGDGDLQAFYEWNLRAGLSFWILAVLWVSWMVLAVISERRSAREKAGASFPSIRRWNRWLVGVPVFGLICGYILNFLL